MYKRQSLNYKWINEEILTYTKKIGDHSFSALAGFVASRYVGESANSSIRGFSDNKIHSMNAGTVLNKPSEDYGASTNASVLGRVTYDYPVSYTHLRLPTIYSAELFLLLLLLYNYI